MRIGNAKSSTTRVRGRPAKKGRTVRVPAQFRAKLEEAFDGDAREIAALRTAAAEKLAREFGQGGWSSSVSDKAVLGAIRSGKVYVLRRRRQIVATLTLSGGKPWAIDASYFTPAEQPLYVTGMAVHPDWQRRGVGRHCMAEVERVARKWPAQVVRLDAYQGPAGAGDFYGKCGYCETGRVVYRASPLIYYELVLDMDATAPTTPAKGRKKRSAKPA